MGTSIYSITSNAYVEMRDRRYRRTVRNRAAVFSVAAVLFSLFLVQLAYVTAGFVPLTAGLGLVFAFASCLCLLIPEFTQVSLLSSVLAAAGFCLSAVLLL